MIRGRQYPVDVFFTDTAVDDYIEAALLTCLQVQLGVSLATLSFNCIL